MFIVRSHDWDTDEITFHGPFSSAAEATAWASRMASEAWEQHHTDVEFDVFEVHAP